MKGVAWKWNQYSLKLFDLNKTAITQTFVLYIIRIGKMLWMAQSPLNFSISKTIKALTKIFLSLAARWKKGEVERQSQNHGYSIRCHDKKVQVLRCVGTAFWVESGGTTASDACRQSAAPKKSGSFSGTLEKTTAWFGRLLNDFSRREEKFVKCQEVVNSMVDLADGKIQLFATDICASLQAVWSRLLPWRFCWVFPLQWHRLKVTVSHQYKTRPQHTFSIVIQWESTL